VTCCDRRPTPIEPGPLRNTNRPMRRWPLNYGIAAAPEAAKPHLIVEVSRIEAPALGGMPPNDGWLP